MSFHMNTDAASLIGSDTFKNGQVEFRKGPILECAEQGGYGILDEINMARNDAVAVLHACLDFRRFIDIPGYNRINLKEETRFIATMNYGYEGTRDLNEALLSRFVVLKMPPLADDDLSLLIAETYPELKPAFIRDLCRLVADIQRKADANEIARHAMDIRGLFDAVDLVKEGLELKESLNLSLVNKIFDPYEEELVADLIKARFKEPLHLSDLVK